MPNRTNPVKLGKAGDRLWFTLAEPPSDFEKIVAEQIQAAGASDDVFYLQFFSWANSSDPMARELPGHLPSAIELCTERWLSILQCGAETTVKIPVETLTHSSKAIAGNIRVTSKEFSFEDQVVIMFACRQEDHDSGYASLRGASDAIGLLSLIFGHNIQPTPIFGNYFNLKEQKFVSGSLIVRTTAEVEKRIFGIKTFYNVDEFLGDSDTVHAALWFVGKAYTERDRASKIVFYQTAMEMVWGSKQLHKRVASCYSGMPGPKRKARETVIRLKKLRHEIVHRGQLGDFSGEFERHVQLLLLDGLVAKQLGALSQSAFGAATRPAKKATKK